MSDIVMTAESCGFLLKSWQAVWITLAGTTPAVPRNCCSLDLTECSRMFSIHSEGTIALEQQQDSFDLLLKVPVLQNWIASDEGSTGSKCHS